MVSGVIHPDASLGMMGPMVNHHGMPGHATAALPGVLTTPGHQANGNPHLPHTVSVSLTHSSMSTPGNLGILPNSSMGVASLADSLPDFNLDPSFINGDGTAHGLDVSSSLDVYQ